MGSTPLVSLRLAKSRVKALTEVPLFDLASDYEESKPALREAFERVLRQSSFILGQEVATFERRAAEFLGTPHAVGVSNGSDALFLALRAVGIGPGDEVVTTPLTFVATAEAILRCGATPVFADIEPEHLGLCPASTAKALSPRTRAVLYVHLFGHPGTITAIADLCAAKGLALIEDACQAFGAKVGDAHVGTLGDCGVFSFFPTKPLGGFGDGGLVVTGRADLADRVRSLRSHGVTPNGHYESLGGNFRLDGLQAALLDVRLSAVDAAMDARTRLARNYGERLADVRGLRCPTPPALPAVSAWSLYSIRVQGAALDARDLLRKRLATAGIETRAYYSTLLCDQPLFGGGSSRAVELGQARLAARTLLSLPLYPSLSDLAQLFVIDNLRRLTQALTD